MVWPPRCSNLWRWGSPYRRSLCPPYQSPLYCHSTPDSGVGGLWQTWWSGAGNRAPRIPDMLLVNDIYNKLNISQAWKAYKHNQKLALKIVKMSFDNQWFNFETLTACSKRKTENISGFAWNSCSTLNKKNWNKNPLAVQISVFVADKNIFKTLKSPSLLDIWTLILIKFSQIEKKSIYCFDSILQNDK